MHGSSIGSGAPKGEANGNYRHGRFTCEALEVERTARDLMRAARGLFGRMK